MGFEAPLALLALAAAGLPVALHLLRRQDLPTRRLPTVALLARAQAASRKRVRVVDLLLLLVRVALIALAALALAQPFLRVTLAYGDGSIASVALVVDDSMSMAGRGDPSLLAQARERARDVIRSLPEGSEVTVVLAGEPARLLVTRTADLDAAARALDEIDDASARATDLHDALGLAERELAGARHEDRRLLVLTDGAAHARLGDVSLPSRVSARFERIGDGALTANAAIVAARATPDPTTPERLAIAVDVRATEMDGRELELVLRRGEEELARKPITIGGGGARVTLHARVAAEQPAAELTLEADDALEMDDRRGLLLRARSGAEVLVVDGERGERGPDFLARAIDLAPSSGGALSRRRVDPETFAAMDASAAEVIVLAGVAAPSERIASRLRAHVERGGGLLIAPGERFDARAYAARLGALLPARPRPAIASESAGPHAAEGSAFFDEGVTGLERATTHRRITFEGIDPESERPLVFGDGSPALVIGRYGDGKVALFATTLDDAWTDLPYRPGYLPLVVSLLRDLASTGRAPQSPVAPGAPVSIEAPAGAVRMDVITPAGERHVYDAAALAEGVEVTDTGTPGVYRVEVATRDRERQPDPRLAFVVAPDAEESDLSPGALPSGATDEPSDDARATVVERPLAPWLFLFVGLLAVLEAALRLRAGQLTRRAA